MNIKVLGPGCAKCNKTADVILKVLEETKTEATLEKDFASNSRHGQISNRRHTCSSIPRILNLD